jgi:hypothetical protein
MRHGSRLCAQVCFRITPDTANHLTDISGLGLTQLGNELSGRLQIDQPC